MDVAKFRDNLRKWLAKPNVAGQKGENFILMFDIILRNAGDRSVIAQEWMEKTGLSFGSFKDYYTRLPDMIKDFKRTEHAIPAMAASLNTAGVEEDFAEAISNTENPDVVDPDIHQPTESVSEAGKQAAGEYNPYATYDRLKKKYDDTHEVSYEGGRARVVKKKEKEEEDAEKTAASKIAQKLLRGDQLTPEMVKQVERAFVYRWTVDNKRRGDVYHCDKCDVKNDPYVGTPSAEGHQHPTIPLQTDDEWLKEHAFYFTNAEKLLPNMHAQPAYLAKSDDASGAAPVLASVAHKFAMEKSLHQAMLPHEFNNADGQAIRNETYPNTDYVSGEADTAEFRERRVGAGSNSGDDDARGAGDLWREEFYEHRTKGISSDGLMSGIKQGVDSSSLLNLPNYTPLHKRPADPSTQRPPYSVGTRDFSEPEVWQCMDCGEVGELDNKGGGCQTCGSQSVFPVSPTGQESPELVRETSPIETEKRMIPRRQGPINAGKTAQGAGNTTVTMQNQNATFPNMPGKAQPMAVPDAIDQQAGPHSPNAPGTAPRTPALQPRIVNVPPGTESEAEMGATASAKYAADFLASLDPKTAASLKNWPTKLILALAMLLTTGGDIKAAVTQELQSRGQAVPAQLQNAQAPAQAAPVESVGEMTIEPMAPKPNSEEIVPPTKPGYNDNTEYLSPEPNAKPGANKAVPAITRPGEFAKSPKHKNLTQASYFEEPNPEEEEAGTECPRCHGTNIDFDAAGDSYAIYCEDCEEVTYRGNLVPASGQVHSDEHEAAGETNPLFQDLDGVWVSGQAPTDEEIKILGTYLAEGGQAGNAPSGIMVAEKWRAARWPMSGEKDQEFLKSVGIKGAALTPAPIANFAEELSDAYSTDNYGGNWGPCIKMMRSRGFDDRAIEAIIRSKHTRWAADSDDRPHGRANSASLAKYLSKQGMTPDSPEVKALVSETFGSYHLEAAAAPTVSPNVQQNMNIVKPQAQAPGPGGSTVAIMPGEEEGEQPGGLRRHTVEPELPNAKYHMMGALIASEEERLAREAGLEE
jgi:hypothetical protein